MSSNADSWGAGANNNNTQGADQGFEQQGKAGGDLLSQLLNETSLFNSAKDMPEVGDVAKALTERLKRYDNQTLTSAQRSIIPEVKELSKQIYDRLPGIVMDIKLGNDVYVMPVVFISSKLANEMDTFDMATATGQQNMATPTVPNQYVDEGLFKNIRRLYQGEFEGAKNTNSVNIISIRLIDLDMYKDGTLLSLESRKDLISTIGDELMDSWYKGVLTQLTQLSVKAGRRLPSPFVNAAPYGNDNCAIVRVEPLRDPISVNGQLTGYNITTKMTTTNPNSTRTHQNNSKTVIDTFATVSLMGQSLIGFNARPDRQNLGMMVNQQTGLPMAYYPFVPVVVYGESNPGQTMGENSGLGTFFMGLHSVLTTNTRQLFSEPLRLVNNGSRGNLTDLEFRLRGLIGQAGSTVVRPEASVMDDKKMRDADFVTNWIRNYVAPNAVIAIDLINYGRNSQEANFLMSSMQSATKAQAMQSIISVIDSLTGGAFSKEVAKTECQWKPDDGILIQSNILIPAGVIKHNDKWIDMSEIDEMFLSHIYKNDQAKVTDVLGKIYGTEINMDIKARRLCIRRALSDLTDGQYHLHGFKTRAFLNPKFAAVFTEVMSKIGAVMVNGTIGNYATAPIAFDTISQYVITASAGSVGFNTASAVQPGSLVFGVMPQ